ncbi:MAG: 50S ribosomal protein L16 [bacterium]
MLMPSRVKYRKEQRGRRGGVAKGALTLDFGSFGLKAEENCWMNGKQIEAMRVCLTRGLKKGGKLWIRLFPHKPISAKPLETRMGKGKGAPAFWAAVVKRGRILVEIDGVPAQAARAALRQAQYKLPIRTRIVSRLSLDEAR